jgi:hypothetical protein
MSGTVVARQRSDEEDHPRHEDERRRGEQHADPVERPRLRHPDNSVPFHWQCQRPPPASHSANPLGGRLAMVVFSLATIGHTAASAASQSADRSVRLFCPTSIRWPSGSRRQQRVSCPRSMRGRRVESGRGLDGSANNHQCRGGPAKACPARRRRVSSSKSTIATTTRMSTIKRRTIPAMRRSTANDPCSAHCKRLRVSSRVPHAAPRAPPCCRTRAARARRGQRILSASRDCDPPTARGEDDLGPRSGMEAALSAVSANRLHSSAESTPAHSSGFGPEGANWRPEQDQCGSEPPRRRSDPKQQRKEQDITTPNRDSLAKGLVSIGDEAVARSNDALLDDYYTDDYRLHSPAGDFNRDEIRPTSPPYARASPTSRSPGRKSSSTGTSSARAR